MSVSGAEAARAGHGAGERVRLRCGRMVHGGHCLARTDAGDSVLVDGAIPGELVEARLTHRRRGLWFARVVEVVEPSPHRVTPPCPYVPECGGCDLQHVAYPHQLELKRAVVVDAMTRQGVPLPAEVRMHGMDEPWAYRWRGEFHVVQGSAGMSDASLGFNRVRSWTPIAVDDCLIHHDAIRRSLPALRAAVRRGADARLTVLHLTVGEEGRELVVRPRPRASLPPEVLDEVALEVPDDVRLAGDSTTLHRRGRMFRAMAESFIQVNQRQVDVLYDLAVAGMGDLRGRRAVDAYAGIGMLSVALAEAASEVVCIESNPAAAHMGRLNARLNGVDDRLRYVVEPVEEALPGVAAAAPVDALVLDPPRAGCEGAVSGWLALAGPPRVVYVSCDPATMARDLHVLVTSGPYVVERLDAVDMFPQTHHVECVAALRRAA